MRRKAWLFLLCGLVLPLVVATSASAQGSTLQVSVQNPTPGQVIKVTGTSFSAAPGVSPVEIRLSKRSGEVLASPTPDSRGNIDEDVRIPPTLAPGWYLLIATQTNNFSGRARGFTPGRVRIRVRAPGAPVAPGGGGGGLPGSPLGLLAGGAALILLATGAAFTARRLRTSTRPRLGS